ncbi:MAG: magnesium chelatase domain-containing protein [Verrucomicrobiia bacterium]
MLAKVHSAAAIGIEGFPVEIEVNSGWGYPGVIISGLTSGAAKASCNRVKTAIENAGFKYVMGRTTINLAPVDMAKEAPRFDLPIAIGILAVSEQIIATKLDDFVIVGELTLNGEVRAVTGLQRIALCARQQNKRGLIVPAGNASEAAVVEGVEVIPVRNLREAAEFLAGNREIQPLRADPAQATQHQRHLSIDRVSSIDPPSPSTFQDFVGQGRTKERLEIAIQAAKLRGESLPHVLLVGPVGVGKATLASIIAKSQGVQIITTGSNDLIRAGDLAGVLTKLDVGDILYIDEIYRVRVSIAKYLVSAMTSFQLDIVID